MSDTEAVVPPQGEIVDTKVDPKVVEFESRRQKFEAERKEFEAQRAAFEAERNAKPPVDSVPSGFSFDEAFEDPVTYFKTKHNLNDEQVMDLVQGVLYAKFPDKKPPNWDQKVTRHQLAKMRREMDDREKRAAEKAKADAESHAAQEYGARIQAEFTQAGDEWEANQGDSYSKAFFENKEEYTAALINIAAEVAGSKKAVPTIGEVKDALEKWLEKRYSRYKPKAENKTVEQAVEQVMAKAEDASTLSVKPPAGAPAVPMTAEERYKKALATASGVKFVR